MGWGTKSVGTTSLGDRLKQERARMGYSNLKAFCRKTGLSAPTVTAIENRGAVPSATTLFKIASVLDCSIDWLIGLEENRMIPTERKNAAAACWLRPSDIGKTPHGAMDYLNCDLWPMLARHQCPQPNTVVYISGPVTGIPEGNRPLFMLAQRMLLSAGCSVFNPSHIDWPVDPLEGDALWQYFMAFCVAAIPLCDSMLMLPNWQNSKGAKEEHRIAKMLGLTIYYSPVLDGEK